MPETLSLPQPSAWITTWAGLIARDLTLLDVAAGRGRHTAFFRQRGNRVVAIDRDLQKIDWARNDPDIELIAADLENGSPWPLGQRRFGGIVVTNYLHRPLFPALIGALDVGGILLYETFMVGHSRFGSPTNPDFLLQDGELLDRLRPPLQVIAYEARMISDPRPALVQRIAARLG